MKKQKPRKILVTGGAGFIGTNFLGYWAMQHPEDEIVVIDKLTYAGIQKNLHNRKLRLILGDICDMATAREAMAGCDIVVHFAAETHVDRSIQEPLVFTRTNVLGTDTLLAAARELQIPRFHHVSTDEVYGHIPLDEDRKWNEDSPYAPRSPYSASKAGADHIVRAHHATYYETGLSNVQVTITNCANNIGPYLFPEKFLALAITNILEGKKIPIYTPGNQVREWLHVQDHCRAIDVVLQKGRAGETYFVGPNNPELSNLEVIRKLLALMGKGEDSIAFVGDRPGHDQKYALDHGKITRELGWKPKFDLDTSLQSMIAWYTHHEDWWKPIKNGEHYRQWHQRNYEGR